MKLFTPFTALGLVAVTVLSGCSGEDQQVGQTPTEQAADTITLGAEGVRHPGDTDQIIVETGNTPDTISSNLTESDPQHVDEGDVSDETQADADMAQSEIIDEAPLAAGNSSDDDGDLAVNTYDTVTTGAATAQADGRLNARTLVVGPVPTTYPNSNDIDVMANEKILASFAGNTTSSKVIVDAFTLSANGSNIDGFVSASATKAQFIPSQPLSYKTLYRATIKARLQTPDTGETISSVHSWSFTTIDPSAEKIVFFKDFDNESAGVYTADDLRKKWNVYSSSGVEDGRVNILAGGKSNPGKVMRIKYLNGKFGAGEGAAQWKAPIKANDELYMSYWVRFDAPFNFVQGGKIPGLAGGKANSGGATPTGSDGWSARMMWRPKGKAVQYMYYPDQPNAKGQDFDWVTDGQKFFAPGIWHRVETRIKMNTPGLRDGIVQSWFDGRLALDRRDVRFRNVNSFSINWLMFSTFFGGSNSSWSATKDEYVYFDNLVVAKSRITSSAPQLTK